MSNGWPDRAAEIEALVDLVELKGGDMARWSAVERTRFARLIVTDAEARRIMEEGRALARLMAVPPPDLGERRRDALAQRIVEAAGHERAGLRGPPVATVREGHAGAAAGTVVDMTTFVGRRPQRSWLGGGFSRSAAGAVAAALVIGLVGGWTGFAGPVVDPMVAALSDELDEGDDVTELAMAADDGELSGEDVW